MENNHDLFDFFKEANQNIESEYKRICKTASEDPGTAGDQGEENWKMILEQWLPPYYQIVTKGRILNENGVASPQMDVIVLSPEYPKQLVNCKRYLSKGVVAVFECKTTLRKENITEFFEHSKQLQRIIGHGEGTPRKELQSDIFYGLLAHSHEWKKEKSKPKDNITNAVEQALESDIEHPIQMPDVICVADLGVWKSVKIVIPPQSSFGDIKENREHGYDRLTVRTGYAVSDSESDLYTPVGAMVFQVLQNLSWKNIDLRNICNYMRKLGIEGTAHGKMKLWDPNNILTKELINQSFMLTNGGFWNEWSMMVS